MATRVKEKTAALKANADKRPRAIARYVRISSRKVKILVDLIRGKNYGEAVAILENLPKASSTPVLKVLNSAAANAEHNMGMDKNDLVVAECFADGGQMLKRMQPVSKGRAYRINKRTSHISVILDTVKEVR